MRRKSKDQKNPLNTHKNWEGQNEEKYISDDENPKGYEPNRKNLVKSNANKAMQNFASHLVLPLESDRQETSFQRPGYRTGKEEKPVSEKRRDYRP